MRTPSPTSSKPDAGYYAIVLLVLVIASWLILTPLVPAVAACTLRRFHLRTSTFALWAAQFPIPAMYNFANTYRVTKTPPDGADESDGTDGSDESDESDGMDDFEGTRYANHFPARLITFVDARSRYLVDGEDRWYVIRSTYREQRIESRFHLRPQPAGGYRVVLLTEDDSP